MERGLRKKNILHLRFFIHVSLGNSFYLRHDKRYLKYIKSYKGISVDNYLRKLCKLLMKFIFKYSDETKFEEKKCTQIYSASPFNAKVLTAVRTLFLCSLRCWKFFPRVSASSLPLYCIIESFSYIRFQFSIDTINVNFLKPSGTLERRCSRGVTPINPVARPFWISNWIVREFIRLQNNEGTDGSHQYAIRAAIVREAHRRDSERGGRVSQDPGAVPNFG